MVHRYIINLLIAFWLLTLAPAANAWRLEAGQTTTNDTSSTATFKSVTFQNAFDVIPVVVVLPTSEGSEPASLRVRNVTTTGFEVSQVEPTNSDGTSGGMTIHYVAIEPGTHKFPDGTQIAAGIHTTSTWQSKLIGPTGWDTVNFGVTLGAAASVAASLQTMNSESGSVPGAPSSPFLSVATRTPTTTSIQLAMERSEDTSGTISAEDIGWIAFPSNDNGTFLDAGGTSIGWDARFTADNIIGWGNCRNYTFTSTSWPNARIIASKNRRDGVDGGWLRRCALSGTTIGLVVDEDTVNDTDRNHTTESAGLISFSDSFHTQFEGTIEASKDVVLATGAYSLPGETVRYKITAQSTGNMPIDTDSLVFVDHLPADLALKVTDIDSPGNGPALFTDGTPSSTLSYSFLSLANLTDDIDFSNDGGMSFDYVPTPDAAGADDNITHVRFSPKGSFQAATPTTTPNFSIEFDAVIK